jgi:hypothetical protein
VKRRRHTAHLFRSARAVQFETVEPTGFWERPDRTAKSLNFRALYFYRESQFSVVSGPRNHFHLQIQSPRSAPAGHVHFLAYAAQNR